MPHYYARMRQGNSQISSVIAGFPPRWPHFYQSSNTTYTRQYWYQVVYMLQ